MIQFRRVLTTGRSLCIVLPKTFAESLGWRRHDMVGLLLEAQGIRIRKVEQGALGSLFSSAGEAVMRRRRPRKR